MNEACRLCLESPKDSSELMTKYSKEIGYILPEIDTNLTENPIICSQCLELLILSYNFKTNCLRIEEDLKEKIDQVITSIVKEEQIGINKPVKDEVEKLEEDNLNLDSIIKEEKIYSCEYCNIEFLNETTWKDHLTNSKYACSRRYRKKHSHVCKICNRQYAYKAALEKHSRRHLTGGNHFECGVCGIRKKLKFQLIEHMRVHTGEKPFRCETCSKSFSQKGSLSTHVRMTHLPDRPFVCEICGKQFAIRAHYKRHLVNHGVEVPKRFICTICGKEFAIQSRLKLHMRRHTGEKPYVCQFCSKSFADKSDLNRHLSIHTGEKRYQCPMCLKKFARKRCLTMHFKSVCVPESGNIVQYVT